MFHIFSSILWVQFYAPGTSVIIVLHYYHIVLNFCQRNSVLEGIFKGLAFRKVFLLGVVSAAKYVCCSSEIPNSADP